MTAKIVVVARRRELKFNPWERAHNPQTLVQQMEPITCHQNSLPSLEGRFSLILTSCHAELQTTAAKRQNPYDDEGVVPPSHDANQQPARMCVKLPLAAHNLRDEPTTI